MSATLACMLSLLSASVQDEEAMTPTPEKRYEADTPDLGESAADALVQHAEAGMKNNHQHAAAAVHAGMVVKQQEARESLHKGSAHASDRLANAGTHLRDMVVRIPDKASASRNAVGEGRQRALASRAAVKQASRETMRRSHDQIIQAHTAMQEQHASILANAASQRDQSRARSNQILASITERQTLRVDEFQDWTKGNLAAAWSNLTTGTTTNVRAIPLEMKSAVTQGTDRTSNAVDSINHRAGTTWGNTTEAMAQSWRATGEGSESVFLTHQRGARKMQAWLDESADGPWAESTRALQQWVGWNTQKGQVLGWQAGMKAATEAWENDDRPMAPLWLATGALKWVWHILLLQPVLFPALLFTGAVGTVGLRLAGPPAVGAAYGLGVMGATGVFVLGASTTVWVALLGSLVTALAAGSGVVNVALEAMGTTVGCLTAALGTSALAVVGSGLALLHLAATPITGLTLLSSTLALFTVERAATHLAHAASVLSIHLVAGLRMPIPVLGWAATSTLSEISALGNVVGKYLVEIPADDLGNVITVSANVLETWFKDPHLAVQESVMATLEMAGGLTAFGIGSGLGAAQAVGGATAHGGKALVMGGLGLIAAGAKVGEFTVAALNIPQHRAWASFRIPEADRLVQSTSISEGAPRVILVRVHWWGADSGRVRFFVTRDDKTGKRWYYQRSVDRQTCEVIYRRTDRDPLARALADDPWTDVFHSGQYVHGCQDETPDVANPEQVQVALAE